MAKKQKSFEEKTSSTKGKDLEHIKFVKSVPSDKEGYWRFNESMIALEKGQKLDAALKQMEDEANLVDIEMPTGESSSEDINIDKLDNDSDNLKDVSSDSSILNEALAEEEAPAEEETPAEEEEAPAEEEAPTEEETPVEEEEAPAEEDSKEKEDSK